MSDRVLATYATAAAWTGEVAEAVGKSLWDGDSTADVIRAKEMIDVTSYGALVVGVGDPGRQTARGNGIISPDAARCTESSCGRTLHRLYRVL